MATSDYPLSVDVIAGVLLVLFGAAWAWMSYLTVRERWGEPSRQGGGLPFSFRPGVSVRARIGGACGFAAFLCVVFLLHTRGR